MTDPKDTMILSLCEKLYICSRTLTCVAEKLGWDHLKVQYLMNELEKEIERSKDASVTKVEHRCPKCRTLLEVQVR